MLWAVENTTMMYSCEDITELLFSKQLFLSLIKMRYDQTYQTHITKNVMLTWEKQRPALCVYSELHGWPVFIRCHLMGRVWPSALLPLTDQTNGKREYHEGCVWLCIRVYVDPCVCKPLRYQDHLSMTAQLCQHNPCVFLSTLVHTIMNDGKTVKYIYLNCSPALIHFSVYIILWLLWRE